MELRPLGSTGIKVSLLGLGTVKLGRNEGVKYPRPFDLPDDRSVVALLETAQSLGINLLDTAPAYGRSEERLGALRPGRREDWVIVTKAGETFERGESFFDFSPAAVQTSVERSLRRLRVDYLDGVLLHSDGSGEDGDRFLPAAEALLRLKEQGKLRATGFSGKTVAGGLKMLGHVDLLMVTYNAGYRDEQVVIDAARQAGKGILIKKALASGHAADPAQALADIAALPGVSSIVVGTMSPDNLRKNAQAVTAALR
ncbi:aldo/keto reductase [uncultured Ferrovibrio sp.]|jgi:aryl-alcohol dehydrogenase-like predicted oxidoreductase|uniref:aldo/keto reductase n=1 Tax=uncultured Ferrovibrio sp. TaxID=1576913 RepID=UPI00262DDB6D|nr:aldo/keto reductase [uncultured Ferrovibrio sp.]